MLAGHRRYAHIAALRGDTVAAQALGMNKVVSEDALRRALERIDEVSSTAWMRPALTHSVREVLDRPWVLDIDASIKPLHGRQEGSEIGYNPGKPWRSSHALHTFRVGNLRLVLDVQVSSGKQHTSAHAKAALGRLLDELHDRRPALVRGDSGYGNEGILLELESRAQPYLLRLRQTANVQRLSPSSSAARTGAARTDSQGCQMVEAQLHLHGRSAKRRVVTVRQRTRAALRASGARAAAGNCGWTCSPACTRASGCGTKRCSSPTWAIRSKPSHNSTVTARTAGTDRSDPRPGLRPRDKCRIHVEFYPGVIDSLI